MASRFSIPIPKGTVAPIDKYATDYKGVVAGIKIDPKIGRDVAGLADPDAALRLRPRRRRQGGLGRLDVLDLATTPSAPPASSRSPPASATATTSPPIDWRAAEKAAAEGKGDMIGGVKVLDPKKVPGIVYFMPCGKSPHGVDVTPDGKWIVGSGKLQGVTTVFNFEKIQTAIRNKDFTGDEDGIPVLKYESIKDAEVAVGLGPLHTQFGPDGYAYTSLFVDSAIAKWKLGTWEVVDKVPMSYSIGHLCAAEGDTRHPRREVPRRPQQALPRPPSLGGPVAARVVAARRHQRGEDEAPLRRLHRARAPLRPDGQGRQAPSRSRSTRRRRTIIRWRSGT